MCGGLSFDHLVGTGKQRIRHRQAEGLSGLEVDDKLEFRRVLHRKVCHLPTLEDAINATGRAAVRVDCVGAVRGQATTRDKEAKGVDRRQSLSCRQRYYELSMEDAQCARSYDQAAIRPPRKGRDGAFDFDGVLPIYSVQFYS